MSRKQYKELTLAISGCALAAALLIASGVAAAHQDVADPIILVICLGMLAFFVPRAHRAFVNLAPDAQRAVVIDLHSERGKHARRRTPKEGDVG